MRDTRNAYTILVGQHENKTSRQRSWQRLEENTKIELKRNAVGGCGLD
jgi:hypothetical protein